MPYKLYTVPQNRKQCNTVRYSTVSIHHQVSSFKKSRYDCSVDDPHMWVPESWLRAMYKCAESSLFMASATASGLKTHKNTLQ